MVDVASHVSDLLSAASSDLEKKERNLIRFVCCKLPGMWYLQFESLLFALLFDPHW